jgi:hypothetical protein
MVVISQGGYCCKFSLELEEEEEEPDPHRQRKYELKQSTYNHRNAKRVGSRSPGRQRQRISLMLGGADEPDSLAKSITPAAFGHSHTLNAAALNNIVNSTIQELQESNQSGEHNPDNQNQQATKPALANFKQPILRLKDKIPDFFSDKKAESNLRIAKR